MTRDLQIIARLPFRLRCRIRNTAERVVLWLDRELGWADLGYMGDDADGPAFRCPVCDAPVDGVVDDLCRRCRAMLRGHFDQWAAERDLDVTDPGPADHFADVWPAEQRHHGPTGLPRWVDTVADHAAAYDRADVTTHEDTRPRYLTVNTAEIADLIADLEPIYSAGQLTEQLEQPIIPDAAETDRTLADAYKETSRYVDKSTGQGLVTRVPERPALPRCSAGIEGCIADHDA